MPRYTGGSGSSSNFPQTSKNRNRGDLKDEIADYSGGGDRGDVLLQAGRSLNQSIREFNSRAWNFNRVTEDLTLASPVSGTVAEYLLNEAFRNPIVAQTVDSNSKTRCVVRWVPWRVWAAEIPDQSATGSIPLAYTARNIHEVGRVIVDPPPATVLTYPTMRVFFHREITCPTADGSIINVPSAVEEAILQKAVALFISKKRSFRDARDAFQMAEILRTRVERDWGDYGEPDTLGGIY